MSVYETQPEGRTDTEHPTVVEDDPRWKGPFTEHDKYGEPTGVRFVRCTGCGVEVLESDTHHATHRDGCDGIGDDDGRHESTRSQPADFGGGESTSVQEL